MFLCAIQHRVGFACYLLIFIILNFDLQRALESYQLKTAVERTTMNDIHMQTIKVCHFTINDIFICSLQYIVFLSSLLSSN